MPKLYVFPGVTGMAALMAVPPSGILIDPDPEVLDTVLS
jgi:hypothetical protein